MLTEEFANSNDEIRWALMPSVLQHVGWKSSKGASKSKTPGSSSSSGTTDIWNFAFERNEPGLLRLEHELQ